MEYLHFYIKEGQGILATYYNKTYVTLQYSYNKTDWFEASNSSDIQLEPNKKVYFKGTISKAPEYRDTPIINFEGDGSPLYAGGSIMSLQDGNPDETTIKYNYEFKGLFGLSGTLVTPPELPATKLTYGCYEEMFKGCTSLNNAPELPATELNDGCYESMFDGCTSLKTAPNLPSVTLKIRCYYGMFRDCTSLKSAPELPATTIASYCYYEMFKGCTSLISAPTVLPATELTDINDNENLAGYCYFKMFEGCTSLTTAPVLPATKISNRCYASMFANCTSLVNAPALPATELIDACYASMFANCTSLINTPELPATSLDYMCYESMFFGCTSLVNAHMLPATTLSQDCYYGMFEGCTSLIQAPDLTATEPAGNCYNNMFKGCSKLNYVKCLLKPNTIVCTTDWLNGVAANGTFIKNVEANNWKRSASGIPTGWTVENYQPTNTYTVTLNGDNCTLTGAGNYSSGTSVEISCIPNTGYYFVRWSDGNTNATRTITVTEDITLTAITAQGSSNILEIKARKGSGEYERNNIIWYLDYKVNTFIWDARVYTDFDNLTTNVEISDDRVTNISKGSSWIGDSRIYSYNMTVPRNDSDTNKEFTINITSNNGILSDNITIRVIQKPKLPVLIEDIFVSSGDVENALVTIPDNMEEVLVVYEDETLARYTIDDCVSNYVLYYRNALGGIDLFPVTGKVIKSNDIEHLTINKKYDNRTLNFGKTNYENVLTERWQLYSGRLTDQQSKLMHHLINSTYVYLYDIQADKFTPVVITDTEMEYKTYKNNNNKMVYYTINVEASQTKYRR